jgi:hypothetical protein
MFVALFFLMRLGGAGSTPLYAQSEEAANRAGVIVVQADGSVESRCVGFAEESIDGYELLVRGGFAPRSDVTSMGVSVCSLDGQGCGEGEDCFCQCQSSPCIYWTFWQQLPEGWRYSNAGPTLVDAHNGDVQGWVWGDSRPNAAAENEPPDLTFEQICTAEAVVYGINEAAPTAETTANQAQGWMITLVVALPLLAGGAWWLLQQRRRVNA